MKIEVGKTYETKNGTTVIIICVDRKGSTNYPIIGLAQLSVDSEFETLLTFTIEGKSSSRTSLDLVPPTEKYVRLDDVIQFLKNRGHSENGGLITSAKNIPVKEIPE